MKQNPKQYTVELKPLARGWLDKTDSDAKRRILQALVKLAESPRGPGIKKLTGANHYRLRVGDYRIIFEIQDERVVVLVVRIGHRRDVYRS
jgi:mRNA interferase RelE/StbE